MASVTITGDGGIKVSGTAKPISITAGAPPELTVTQWGLYRFDVRPRPEEKY